MDFTLRKYKLLLITLLESGYQVITFEHFLCGKNVNDRFVVLRHDVDELANHALKIAELENKLGIKATYFFRIVKQSNNPDVIRKIAAMGHEIGYHYEDLSTAEGDYEMAIKSFEKNLNYFRNFYPVKTVCMHGSSTSKYDNRLLWSHYKLEKLGLIGEPYLSIDFTKIFYLTDTGYAWDGGKFATRDVVENHFGLTFHSTEQIVESVKAGTFPQQAMILAHTLWTDSLCVWMSLHLREFVRNNIKLMARDNRMVSYIYKKAVDYYWKK